MVSRTVDRHPVRARYLVACGEGYIPNLRVPGPLNLQLDTCHIQATILRGTQEFRDGYAWLTFTVGLFCTSGSSVILVIDPRLAARLRRPRELRLGRESATKLYYLLWSVGRCRSTLKR